MYGPTRQHFVFLMIHVWAKLCRFIHYNVQYVVFVVAYIMLKL